MSGTRSQTGCFAGRAVQENSGLSLNCVVGGRVALHARRASAEVASHEAGGVPDVSLERGGAAFASLPFAQGGVAGQRRHLAGEVCDVREDGAAARVELLAQILGSVPKIEIASGWWLW